MLSATVAAIVVALVSAGTASASCRGGQIGPVAVRSGDWNGQSWKLQAEDSGDGRYALTVFVAGQRRATLSGRFYIPTRNAGPVNFGWAASFPGTAPTFVVGALTVKTARTITVGLSNATVSTVETIPPRCLLQPDISFFVERIPSGTHAVFFNARNAAGRVVASWRR
jgi:hypothetical protein